MAMHIETQCSYPTPYQPTTIPTLHLPACQPACQRGGSCFLLCKSQKIRGSITPRRGRVSDLIFIDRNEHHESMVKRISKQIQSSNTSLSLQRGAGHGVAGAVFAYSRIFSACQGNCEKGRPPFCCIYAVFAVCLVARRAATTAYMQQTGGALFRENGRPPFCCIDKMQWLPPA